MADKNGSRVPDGEDGREDAPGGEAPAQSGVAAQSEASANGPDAPRAETTALVTAAVQGPSEAQQDSSAPVAAPNEWPALATATSALEKPHVEVNEDEIDLIPVHAVHAQCEAATASEKLSNKPAAAGEKETERESKTQDPGETQAPQAAREPVANGSSAPAVTGAPEAAKPQSDDSKEKKPPPPPPPKPKAPRPNSLGNAYMQSQDRKPTEGRVYFAIAVFVLIFTGILAGQWWWSSQPDEPAKVPDLDISRFEGRAQQRRTILEEMDKAAKTASQAQTFSAAATGQDRNRPVPKEAKSAPPAGAQKAARATRKDAAPPQEAEQPDPLRQQYEAEYGAASSMRAAAIRSRGQHETVPQQGKKGLADARGLVLQASLVTTAASSPVGASVIASLTQGVRLNDRYLAAQTEIHGQVSGGGDNARVFVNFTYARLPDGTTLDLDAVATDRSGREGIPGLRPLTGRTAGSVGLSGGQAMARGAAHAIPGFAGVIASGASAMADAASEKSQRLDRDEVIVQANSNTPIAIYVRSSG